MCIRDSAKGLSQLSTTTSLTLETRLRWSVALVDALCALPLEELILYTEDKRIPIAAFEAAGPQLRRLHLEGRADVAALKAALPHCEITSGLGRRDLG